VILVKKFRSWQSC